MAFSVETVEILIYDSLPPLSYHKQCLEQVSSFQRWVRRTFDDCKLATLQEKNFTVRFSDDCPKQLNGFDCKVFSIINATLCAYNIPIT